MSMHDLRSHPRVQELGALTEPVMYDKALKQRMNELFAELSPGSEVLQRRLAAFSALQGDDLITWGRVTGYFDLEKGYYGHFEGVHVFIGCTGGSENPVGMQFAKGYIIAAVAYDEKNQGRLKAPEILYDIQFGEGPKGLLRELERLDGTSSS
jgi:hypothetical protein